MNIIELILLAVGIITLVVFYPIATILGLDEIIFDGYFTKKIRNKFTGKRKGGRY